MHHHGSWEEPVGVTPRAKVPHKGTSSPSPSPSPSPHAGHASAHHLGIGEHRVGVDKVGGVGRNHGEVAKSIGGAHQHVVSRGGGGGGSREGDGALVGAGGRGALGLAPTRARGYVAEVATSGPVSLAVLWRERCRGSENDEWQGGE